ncbi:MAG TPA: CHAD domain-containing protein [Solirubrobacteraceae bacterium]
MSGAPKAKVVVPLAPGQRADAAAVAVLRGLCEVIEGNREGAISGDDPEYLHQLRIAVRRSRTVQRQLKHVFPALELAGFRSEFKWLQRATGEARDLDVYLIGFDELRHMVPEDMRADLGPLRQVLGHWRLGAQADMARAVGSRRTVELLRDWEMLLERLVEIPADERPDAVRPIGELAGRRIRHVYKQIRKDGQRIDAGSPPTAFHELRKTGKELRYMLELFGVQLHDPVVVSDLVTALKELQDVLGRHQDREVQIAMLRSLADEVAGLPRGPQAVLAMGVLIERLRADELAARHEFGERFALLAASERHDQVKATFG